MAEGLRLAHDWLNQSLPSNVAIGEGSWVYSAFAFLHSSSRQPGAVRIGDHTGIYNGTFFDLGPDGEVEVGDYCSIVGAIISTNGRVSIGDYTFIAHEVVIADHPFATPPQEVHSASRAGARLGDDVWVGMGAVILGPVNIGDGAVIAARTVVAQDVPPLSVVAGNPATIVRRLVPGP